MIMKKLAIMLCAALLPLALAAQTKSGVTTALFTDTQETIVMARGGDFHGTTENSREALRKTSEKKAQVAVVELKTADDGTVCLNCDEERITLSEILQLVQGKLILAFKNPEPFIDAIRQEVKTASMEQSVLLYGMADPKGEIGHVAVVDLDGKKAKSALSKALKSKPIAVELDFSSMDNVLLTEAIETVRKQARVAFNICGTEPGKAGGLSDSGKSPDGVSKTLEQLIGMGGSVFLTDQIKPCMWYLHPETKQQQVPRQGQQGVGGPQGGRGQRNGHMEQNDGKSMTFSKDETSTKLLQETVGKFTQHKYRDELTGQTLDYHLSLPMDYDPTKKYPLVLFIGDASTVGGNVMYPLTQGWGGLIWASEESQRENPCFVLVPHFRGETPNIELPGNNPDGDAALRLTEQVVKDYPAIDTNRLYKTGQSKGGMISMYLSIEHPDVFAASFFVGCQWDTKGMECYPEQKFFYVVAEGDTRACPGMAAVKAVLDSLGTSYTEEQWSAKAPMEEQEANVQRMIAEGKRNNFIIFDLGTTLPENGQGMEHMWSFDYAYRLKAIRDWLFKQSK